MTLPKAKVMPDFSILNEYLSLARGPNDNYSIDTGTSSSSKSDSHNQTHPKIKLGFLL